MSPVESCRLRVFPGRMMRNPAAAASAACHIPGKPSDHQGLGPHSPAVSARGTSQLVPEVQLYGTRDDPGGLTEI